MSVLKKIKRYNKIIKVVLIKEIEGPITIDNGNKDTKIK